MCGCGVARARVPTHSLRVRYVSQASDIECVGYSRCDESVMCTTPPQSAVRVSECSGATSAVCELLIGPTNAQLDAIMSSVRSCVCEIDVQCVWVLLCWYCSMSTCVFVGVPSKLWWSIGRVV